MPKIALWRRLLAEFLGTALLVTAVVGSGIMATTLSPNDVGLQLLENSVATAFALGALILTFGPLSGAHFNPVVSAADWFVGRREGTGLTLTDVAGYIAAQITGAIAGSILANLMFDLDAVTFSTKDRSAGPGESEDQQDQAGGGDDLPEPKVPGAAVLAGEVDGGQVEHEIRKDGSGDRSRGLGDGVPAELGGAHAGAAAPADQPVRGRHDRVEMRSGHGPEGEDERAERERRGDRVLEQLQADVARRQPRRHDAGADDGGDQQRGADELGEQPPPGRNRIHGYGFSRCRS